MHKQGMSDMHEGSENVETAREYLRGKSFGFPELNQLWKDLKAELEFGYARNVLALLREGAQLSGDEKAGRKDNERMAQQHALCTSKDPDLSAAERHDAALRILGDLVNADLIVTEKRGKCLVARVNQHTLAEVERVLVSVRSG